MVRFHTISFLIHKQSLTASNMLVYLVNIYFDCICCRSRNLNPQQLKTFRALGQNFELTPMCTKAASIGPSSAGIRKGQCLRQSPLRVLRRAFLAEIILEPLLSNSFLQSLPRIQLLKQAHFYRPPLSKSVSNMMSRVVLH